VLVVVVSVGVGAAAVAHAEEPRGAIAPVPVGQGAPAALQRAFQDELPRALAEAGFSLKAPNEVDMQISERPEFLRCSGGGCLAEEAAFLHVALLLLPRFEPAPDRDGFTVGLTLFDAGEKRAIADVVDRCAPCSVDRLRGTLRAVAKRLRTSAQRPGELEVASEPTAQLSVDGRAIGATPWRGPMAAGHHVVTLEAGGARIERDVTVEPGRTAKLSVKLDVALPPVPPARAHGRFYVVKWVALAAGIAAAGAGAGLWAIDGNPTCSRSGTQLECPHVYDTLPVGAALVGVGGALLVTSVVMLALDKPAAPKAAAVLLPSRDGASVVVEGRF